MKNIIWLASYPKSGNTWYRIFLSNLLGDDDTPLDINNITSTNGIASARGIFDEICALDSSDLSFDEIDNLRPELYRIMSDEADKTLFIKAHDAYTFLRDGTPLFPSYATKGVIYIIRNPLDVAVSYANHNNCSIQKSIDMMGMENHGLSNKFHKLPTQLRQKLLSWSNHVKSWTNATDINVHILRYEDMKQNPLETFSAAVKFSGFDFDPKQINEAEEKSRFEELQKQEQERGFKEKTHRSKKFFRKGKIGNWREHLTKKQVHQIINNHKKVMMKYGYLTKTGELVY